MMEVESGVIVVLSFFFLLVSVEGLYLLASLPPIKLALLLLSIVGSIICFKIAKAKILTKTASARSFENLMVGHRGCRLPKFIENTIPALKHAIDNGADAVEIDIRLSKDDVPVVFHDCFLHRLINVEGRIEDYTLAELKSFHFRTDSSVTIPTLDEVVDLIQERKVKLFIESKERREIRKMAKLLVELYEKRSLYEEACVISFNAFFLWFLHWQQPRIVSCLLYKYNLFSGWATSDTEELSLLLKLTSGIVDFVNTKLSETVLPALVGSSMIGPHRNKASTEFIENWQESGYALYFWVINTKEEWDWLKSTKVSLGTDFPHLFQTKDLPKN